MANLFKVFTESFRRMGWSFLCGESDSHGRSYSDGWRTADSHGSNGLCHRGGISAIQITNLLRKLSLIKDSHLTILPFNGFKFHKKHPKYEIALADLVSLAMTVGAVILTFSSAIR
jgi:hypothetical protein